MCVHEQRALHRQASLLSERHIVIDISNPRFGVPIKDPEGLFVPFKGSFEGQMDTTVAGELVASVIVCHFPTITCMFEQCGTCCRRSESWQPVRGSADHVQAARSLWKRANEAAALADKPYLDVPHVA